MPARISVTMVCIALAAACAPQAGDDNGSLEITVHDFACKSCEIVAESIAYLGHPDDTVSVSEFVLPVTDSRGRYYAAAYSRDAVLVFAPDGRFMSSFGRAGSGPGEFSRIGEIYITSGDTLLVIGRRTVHVVGPDYTHVRQYARSESNNSSATAVLSDGRRVVPSSRGAFTIVDAQGVESPPVRLQGADTTPCTGNCRDRVFREALGGGAVWSGPPDAYVLEKHSLSGELLKRITREVDWFESRNATPTTGSASNPALEFAKPILLGVQQASDGIVYSYVLMVDNINALPKSLDPNDREAMAALVSMFVTRVEAFDPETNEVIAATTLPSGTIPLTRGLSAQPVVEPSGDWTLKIVKLQVTGRN